MAEASKRLSLDQPATYEIRVQGVLADDWAIWFGTMTITIERDITILASSLTRPPCTVS